MTGHGRAATLAAVGDTCRAGGLLESGAAADPARRGGWMRAHETQARLAVATELLEDYNDAWRHEDEEITEAAFIRRIELVRIWFEDDGSLILSYDGRDLFDGRAIDGEFKADRSFGGAYLVD